MIFRRLRLVLPARGSGEPSVGPERLRPTFTGCRSLAEQAARSWPVGAGWCPAGFPGGGGRQTATAARRSRNIVAAEEKEEVQAEVQSDADVRSRHLCRCGDVLRRHLRQRLLLRDNLPCGIRRQRLRHQRPRLRRLLERDALRGGYLRGPVQRRHLPERLLRRQHLPPRHDGRHLRRRGCRLRDLSGDRNLRPAGLHAMFRLHLERDVQSGHQLPGLRQRRQRLLNLHRRDPDLQRRLLCRVPVGRRLRPEHGLLQRSL